MLAAVILSGGASRRMGSPKALVSYQGASFLEHLLSVTRHPAIGARRVVLGPDADAIALPAERGSAWTLRYPQYSVVVPAPGAIQIPLAFALPKDEPALGAFVDTWITLKRADGTFDDLYRYWILGQDPARPVPRWSVIRNVLHWVD